MLRVVALAVLILAGYLHVERVYECRVERYRSEVAARDREIGRLRGTVSEYRDGRRFLCENAKVAIISNDVR